MEGETLKQLKARQKKERKELILSQLKSQISKQKRDHLTNAEVTFYIGELKSYRQMRQREKKELRRIEKEYDKKVQDSHSIIEECRQHEEETIQKLSVIFPDSCPSCGLPVDHEEAEFECQDDATNPKNPFHHLWWGVEFTPEEIYDLQYDPFKQSNKILKRKLKELNDQSSSTTTAVDRAEEEVL
jgi:hypothetical protein